MTRCEVTASRGCAVMFGIVNMAFSVTANLMEHRPVVNTTYGPVTGTARESSTGATMFSFFGIPFAQPPLGSLRWRAPMPPKPWVEPLDLSSKPTSSDQCLQPSDDPSFGGTEDCLKVHVHTPHLNPSGGQALPVMLWIHGGGFVFGDAWLKGIYDGMELAQRFQVVVFAAQYRLGALGFLALEQLQQEDPNLSTGNYGVMDQRAAMRWVRDNAASFGGDPQRVIIFGESAGGESMCYHLTSPASRGLFDAVIMESGTCDNPYQTVATKQLAWKAHTSLINCTWGSPEYLDCLRAMDGATLQTITQKFFTAGLTLDRSRVGLLDVPIRRLGSGMFNKVPVIMGTNSFEFIIGCTDMSHVEKCNFMSLWFGGTVPNTQKIRGFLENAFERKFSDTQMAKVVEMYKLEEFDGNRMIRVGAMVADFSIGECGTLRAGQAIARAGVPVWMYRMKRLGDVDFVQHGDEIPFVFQMRHSNGMAHEENRMASSSIGEYWTNFAKFHDPNRAAISSGQDQFWPMMNASSPVLAIFDGIVQKPGHPERAPFCKFWQKLFGEESVQSDHEQTVVV